MYSLPASCLAAEKLISARRVFDFSILDLNGAIDTNPQGYWPRTAGGHNACSLFDCLHSPVHLDGKRI